jgi:aminocarboxymuconate-semialdehyde decarboxylase
MPTAHATTAACTSSGRPRTVVFDPEQLAYMARRFGADHLLLGTDYPYDMAEADPVGFVLSVPGLSDEERARICGGNAARLLGIVPGCR